MNDDAGVPRQQLVDDVMDTISDEEILKARDALFEAAKERYIARSIKRAQYR